MSWAKRNLYFLIAAVVAVVLLGAAGWFCYTSWQTNNATWDQLSAAYTQVENFANENPGPGNKTVNNIQTAQDETKDANERVAAARKFFRPIPGIPNTNHFDDRMLAFAVRETIAQLRSEAAQHNVALPLDYAFSFSLQQAKVVYDSKSWEQLSKQLGEVRTICDVLYNARVAALDSVQRERTADDNNAGQPAQQPDYVDTISVTNNNIVITPYEVTFRCFTPELGSVLSSFANQSHTMVVKALTIQPEDSTAMTEGMPGMAGGGGYGYGAARPPTTAGGLPVVIDEKKLRVTMLLDIVKMLPEAGR
jgi:predicted negative regulator of RcsB-dependent stress response